MEMLEKYVKGIKEALVKANDPDNKKSTGAKKDTNSKAIPETAVKTDTPVKTQDNNGKAGIPKVSEQANAKDNDPPEEIATGGMSKIEESETSQNESESSSKGNGSALDKVVMNIEKIEGKLQNIEESRNQMMQKMFDMSERVGEVRSMVLERERRIGDVEISAAKMSDMIEEIEPKKFIQKMEKITSKLSKIEADSDKTSETITVLKSELSKINDKTSKIGDFKSLSDMHREISKALDELNSKRNETFMISSKVESMFGELSAHFPELNSIKSKQEASFDVLQTAVKDLDKLKLKMDAFKNIEDLPKKMESVVQKKDIEQVKDHLESVIKETDANMGTLTKKLSDFERKIKECENIQNAEKKNDAEIKKMAVIIDAIGTELQHIRQTEDVGSDIDKVLAEYEKINDAWKWETDKRLKDFDTRSGLILEKISQMTKDMQRNGQGIDKNSAPSTINIEECFKNINNRINAISENMNELYVTIEKMNQSRINEKVNIAPMKPALQTANAMAGTIPTPVKKEAKINANTFDTASKEESEAIKEIDAASRDIEKAENLIARNEFKEANALYSKSFDTYLKHTASSNNMREARVKLLELYRRLNEIKSRLKK